MCEVAYKQSNNLIHWQIKTSYPFHRFILFSIVFIQGATKNGSSPDGTSYLDSAEKDEIKALLK